MNGQSTMTGDLRAAQPGGGHDPWHAHARSTASGGDRRVRFASWAWPVGLGCGILLWVALVWEVGATTL
jgi:hypothetical protein